MKTTRRVFLNGLSMMLITSAVAGALERPAFAQEELRVATSYKIMTLDSQYANLNENNSLLSQIYERLVYQDENLALTPGLAVSWRPVSDTRWEFKLRSNVHFHDGSEFTADDVVYSIERIRTFLKPPGEGFRGYLKGIKTVSAPDASTVLIDTDGTIPDLPLSFASLFIMHRPAQGFQTTEELNAGGPPVGTGPYKFNSWTSGETLKLVRNDNYWGRKPAWPMVVLRVIESPAARVAALATGDVDLADSIPARDVQSLKQRGVQVESIGAARVNFLQFDVKSEMAPGVTANNDEPIGNPFKDQRVRRALAMATDRSILVDKILSGYGTAAGQLFPTGLPGTSGQLTPEAPDYEKARKLLAEAGYPDGFKVMLAGSTGRYPGDAESLQAVAQSWARVGVTVQPTAAPFSVFNTRRAAGEYGVWYGGCSGESVDVILDALLASPDPERGLGALNFGGYRNEAFDRKLAEAESLREGPERDRALAAATELVMADQPIIPLYHFHHIVGFGPKIGSYVMHPRGWTTAMQTIPVTE